MSLPTTKAAGHQASSRDGVPSASIRYTIWIPPLRITDWIWSLGIRLKAVDRASAAVALSATVVTLRYKQAQAPVAGLKR